MKYWVVMLISCFLYSCKSEDVKPRQFYKATNKEGIALLSLTLEDNRFYGQYKIQYSTAVIDSGEVRGVIVGDTLQGRFKYISYGGSQVLKPFLLLKRGDTLKLGSGSAYTYLEIPYFLPQSIRFKDSDFQFLPISEEAFMQSDFKRNR